MPHFEQKIHYEILQSFYTFTVLNVQEIIAETTGKWYSQRKESE
jgi:hypothetical protein